MGSLHLLPLRIGNYTRQVKRVSCTMRQSQALEISSYLSAGDDIYESGVDLGKVCLQFNDWGEEAGIRRFRPRGGHQNSPFRG